MSQLYYAPQSYQFIPAHAYKGRIVDWLFVLSRLVILIIYMYIFAAPIALLNKFIDTAQRHGRFFSGVNGGWGNLFVFIVIMAFVTITFIIFKKRKAQNLDQIFRKCLYSFATIISIYLSVYVICEDFYYDETVKSYSKSDLTEGFQANGEYLLGWQERNPDEVSSKDEDSGKWHYTLHYLMHTEDKYINKAWPIPLFLISAIFAVYSLRYIRLKKWLHKAFPRLGYKELIKNHSISYIEAPKINNRFLFVKYQDNYFGIYDTRRIDILLKHKPSIHTAIIGNRTLAFYLDYVPAKDGQEASLESLYDLNKNKVLIGNKESINWRQEGLTLTVVFNGKRYVYDLYGNNLEKLY